MSGNSPKSGEITQSNIPPEAANPPLGRDVFLSYASQDSAVANSLVETLEKHWVTCWIAPRDVVPGSLYADEIVGAINDTKVVVLVLSQHSIASPHVGKELERASSKRHRIIAFHVDAVPLTRSFEYFLNESQWIDARAGGREAAGTKLVEAVRRHLNLSATIDPRAQADSPMTRAVRATRKRWLAAGSAILSLALAYFIVHQFWLSKRVAKDVNDIIAWGSASTPATLVTDKSIAVLPFADMSEKKDQEYFADGMAEEILDVLVKIPGLKVIGRTSSFQFKGRNVDLRTIGTQLGARYVLEGSVRKSADRLRVTAQLIDSHDGTHLMSQVYDRDIGDALKTQDEIAASLVRALQVEVGADPFVFRPVTHNSEAYASYLQGRHAYERYDKEGFEQAESDLKRALELDPSMAGAAAFLALVYDSLGEWGFLTPAVTFEQARHAAQHALELDPKNVLGHLMLGSIHDAYDWDWPAAEREQRQALAIAPSDPSLALLLARHLMIIGRWDDALKMVNASLAQDPLNPPNNLLLNWVQVRRGRLIEAEAAARRVLEIIPTYTAAHYYLAIALLARGERKAALEEFQKETDDATRLGGLAIAFHSLGREGDSDAALAQMRKDYSNRFAFGIAEVYAYRGEVDQALQWLDRAYAQKDSTLYMVKGEWPFRGLETDPRYKAFLRTMNLPE